MRSRGRGQRQSLRMVLGAAVAIALVGPALARAQATPTPANPRTTVAPKADERPGANPSQGTKRKKTASSGRGPQKEKITASDSDDARTAPKAAEGTGANPSRKITP